mgnify:CR=1 FL=1
MNFPPIVQRAIKDLNDEAVSYTTNFPVRRIYEVFAILIKLANQVNETLTISVKSGITIDYDTIIVRQPIMGIKDIFFTDRVVLSDGDQIKVDLTKDSGGSGKVGIAVQAYQWLVIADPSPEFQKGS